MRNEVGNPDQRGNMANEYKCFVEFTRSAVMLCRETSRQADDTLYVRGFKGMYAVNQYVRREN